MKQRQKGDKYRPIVHIEKTKGEVPTVVFISGRRYILTHESQIGFIPKGGR